MDGNGFQERFHGKRTAMVEFQLRQRGVRDERVLQAMAKVPRHEFVPASFQLQAYKDQPLPIGEGQTVSQPYIVAAMLESLELTATDRVLEIGTGSGYQTALLAELAAKVFSIELRALLAEAARVVLGRLSYQNVEVRVGDGSMGWPEKAPFDAMVISAAVPDMPPSLIAQMKEGSRCIAPVGSPEMQELQLIRLVGGELLATRLDGCRFVPLIGREGFAAA